VKHRYVTLGVLPAVISRLYDPAGRDGLTHNMLENIHSHWKRKRVCKIKCKGVCTVVMDNVCQQVEVFSSFPLLFGSVACGAACFDKSSHISNAGHATLSAIVTLS